MKIANFYGIFVFACCFFHSMNAYAQDFKSLFADGLTNQKHPAGSLYYGTVKDSQQELVIRKRAVTNKFSSEFKKIPVGTSSLNKNVLLKNIESFCSHLVSGKDLNADPDGCTLDGTNALDKCDLGGVINPKDVARVKRLLDVFQGDKKSECVAHIGKLANDSLAVDGAILQTTIENVTDVAEDARLEMNPNSPSCLPNKKGKNLGCDEFKDTPMTGGLSNELMSRFIVDFNGFGGFFKKLFLIRSTTNECEVCFGEKYKTLQQASNLASDDFEKKYKEKLTDAKINFRVRKAEKALSEYIKFQERNQFMSRYLNGRLETCENISGLTMLKPGCDAANAKLVLDKIAERHKIQHYNTDLSYFVNSLSKSHMNKLEEPVSVPACGANMKVTYTSYMAAYQTQVGTNHMQPSKLFTTETKEKLKKCLEYDQQCMLDILTDAFSKQYGVSSSVATRKVRSYFRQPFYRTLLTHRDSLFDYADSGDVSVSQDLATYKEKNKDRLATIANRDSDVACKAFGNDFMLALCVSDDAITKEYSGQGVKEELADMLASSDSSNQPGDAGKSLVNITVACNMLNKAGNLDTEIHESNSVSDKSFDRLELADSFLRSNLNHSSRLSRKQNSFIDNYAKKLCADAIKEREQENKRNEANKGIFAKLSSSSPWDFSSLSCTGAKVINIHGECVPKYLASVESLNISASSEAPSSNIGHGSDFRMVKPLHETIFDKDEYDSFRYDQKFTSSGSYDIGFMTNEPIPKAIIVNEETIQEKEQGGTFLESTSQMVENLNKNLAPQNIDPAPNWAIPIFEAPKPARGPTGEVDEDGYQGDRRKVSSEKYLQEEEERQTKAEQQAFSQIQQSQSIQDLKSQTQIEQIRLELQKLQMSNKELMSSIKKLSTQRKSQAEENVFDQNVDQGFEQTDERLEDKQAVNTRSLNRQIAQIPRTRFDNSSSNRVSKNSPPSTAPQATLPKQGTGNAATSRAASGVNAGVVRGGAQAVSSRGNSNSSSANFVPSLGVQKTIASESTEENIPHEKKIELLKEFLSYVEKNPEYKDGRYLNSENDKLTIDFKGKTVTLSVSDIQDSKARVDLQERLLRQRMVINQYVRTTRLENLKRLLASTRDQP